MIVDNWNGLGVYSSDDMSKGWIRQPENILREPGTGSEDGVQGQHADVVVDGDRAYIFYFVHPGRATSNQGVDSRRSLIQVAELEYTDGVITCDRDKPVYINLQPKN